MQCLKSAAERQEDQQRPPAKPQISIRISHLNRPRMTRIDANPKHFLSKFAFIGVIRGRFLPAPVRRTRVIRRVIPPGLSAVDLVRRAVYRILHAAAAPAHQGPFAGKTLRLEFEPRGSTGPTHVLPPG